MVGSVTLSSEDFGPEFDLAATGGSDRRHAHGHGREQFYEERVVDFCSL
jgi:hypothetical protein